MQIWEQVTQFVFLALAVALVILVALWWIYETSDRRVSERHLGWFRQIEDKSFDELARMTPTEFERHQNRLHEIRCASGNTWITPDELEEQADRLGRASTVADRNRKRRSPR